MKKLFRCLMVVAMVLSLSVCCYASALTDYQAAQAKVANLTVQMQQAAVLAQTDPAQAQNYQTLQAQLAQAQQQMQTLQAAAAQEMQQQQTAAMQAQQKASMQIQQPATQIQTQQPTENDPIVYIPATGDGTKYHRANCRTIKYGVTAVTLSQAQAMGRGPCGVCYK